MPRIAAEPKKMNGRVKNIPIGTKVKQASYQDEFIPEMKPLIGKFLDFKPVKVFEGWYDSLKPNWTFHESWIEFEENK